MPWRIKKLILKQSAFIFWPYLNKLKKLKPNKLSQKSKIKNQQGMVTIPFLLVLIIILFLILSFFGLTMTLAHISVTQYMTYSAGRKLSLGGINHPDHKREVREHYKELRGQLFNPKAHTGATGDWFLIDSEIQYTGEGGEGGIGYLLQEEKPEPALARKLFYGVGVYFKSHITQLKIPFLIKNTKDELSFRVMSFLGRAPNQTECEDFNAGRIKEIAKKCEKKDCPRLEGQPSIREGDNGC